MGTANTIRYPIDVTFKDNSGVKGLTHVSTFNKTNAYTFATWNDDSSWPPQKPDCSSKCSAAVWTKNGKLWRSITSSVSRPFVTPLLSGTARFLAVSPRPVMRLPGAAQNAELLLAFGQEILRPLQVAGENVHTVLERLEAELPPHTAQLDGGLPVLVLGQLAAVGRARLTHHRDAVLRQRRDRRPRQDRPQAAAAPRGLQDDPIHDQQITDRVRERGLEGRLPLTGCASRTTSPMRATSPVQESIASKGWSGPNIRTRTNDIRPTAMSCTASNES
ncbi:hypothetical protein ACFXKC_43680 [Streptomyces sp. NPDC059340]|uniref:hypothetical protein n=1 Tax=Streptomyces sp. NPDC059340 TaxID=3346806 RepID=UPI00368B2467